MTSTILTRIGLGVAAAAFMTGIALGASPLASALPEGTIKSECKSAGGKYSTSVGPDGNRYSECSYTDSSGVLHIDQYKNGRYTGTFD
ncbi:hypothetical protein MGALJ_40610 [Mycobacterium gallinarum]|uniref:Uncharacterized protein n=1 Tax=Mycobacterium gallinarum TaxID=39689 RepID=A0A9W4FGJ5_9MYCO|nr:MULTISPECIES: hypothetical protein [Mycobacterium]MDV3131665.1 hypothetical protein [Mycobacterium sp. 29Ha]BBY94392.1 hypothetical protein MGALJ_40610 [Mycobacterium gallinarum]